MKDIDIDDDLTLEDEPILNDYNFRVKKIVDDCYGAIAWFDNGTRFQIITELVRRFKIDEDGQAVNYPTQSKIG